MALSKSAHLPLVVVLTLSKRLSMRKCTCAWMCERCKEANERLESKALFLLRRHTSNLWRNVSGACMEGDKHMSSTDFISNLVMRGTSKEVRGLACPKCSGALKIGVYRGTRLVSAQVKCKNCDFILRLDGSSPVPPWVAELGLEFETAP
jgi:hypothetical protein